MSVTGVAASDQDGFAADSEHVRHEGGGIGDLLGGLLGGGGLGSALEAGVGAGVGRQVGGGMGSVPGGGLGAMLPALLPVVLGMLGGKAGGTDRPGVHQLVNTVHEKGLGDVAASWVGTGAFSRKASYGGQPRGLGYRSALDHEGDPVALSFVALDFETANAFRGSPCAVGLARVLDGEVVETARWLMRPPAGVDDFDDFNVSLHGITKAVVRGGPRFAARLQLGVARRDDRHRVVEVNRTGPDGGSRWWSISVAGSGRP